MKFISPFEITINDFFYRPIRYSGGEIEGTAERARYMVSIAEESLKDVEIDDSDKPGFRRFIRKEPLGKNFT